MLFLAFTILFQTEADYEQLLQKLNSLQHKNSQLASQLFAQLYSSNSEMQSSTSASSLNEVSIVKGLMQVCFQCQNNLVAGI